MTSKFIASKAQHFPACVFVVLLCLSTAQASEKVVYQFSQPQVASPYTGVVSDSAGNLYGATDAVGVCPAVYELSPTSSGTYKQTVLYTFPNCFKVGIYPIGLFSLDPAGNLYGAGYSNLTDGSGLVYELIKGANGTWTYKLLHNFGPDEGGPHGDLTWDSAGNLYGATSYDSITFQGEVFELSPQPNGSWKETVLFTFLAANGVSYPASGITFDSLGNLYGTTFYGVGGNNEHSAGAVYQLSPQAGGPWKLAVAFNFTFQTSAQYPNSKPIFDSSGNLYGTSQGPNYGTVFELTPAVGRPWTETTLHSFAAGSDGGNTIGNLAFDANGNLYGATLDGGNGCNHNLCGVVYKLAPQPGGTWKESVVHEFESAEDGSTPYAGLFLDGSGKLYGTTAHGGSRYGYGTVYEITP
jgi:hypothetical protein